MGFFKPSTLVAPPKTLDVPHCGACGLWAGCHSPKMPITGEGRRGVLVVAEAPGEEEDARGVQLVGNAGKLLRASLREINVDLDRDCWKTNALICRPEGGRAPTTAEIGYCRPNVIRAIRELCPRVVLLLGDAAVKSVIGWLWKSDTGPISRWVGYQIPCREIDAWICPAYHPQYVSYEEGNKAVRLIFERDVQAAFLMQGRPELIQQPRVDLEHSPRAAAAFLREVVRRGGTLTIDYETNRLKPDSENARIVCAAVNWQGKRVLAFPWHGEAIDAWRDLIWSPHPKIAANMKFEQRWSKRFFGRGVRNWVWDTMQAGHVVDNRHGVTSVKFQAFAMLGESAYDDHIEQFLQDSDERGVNNIQDIEIGQLLQYCADDVRVEWQIAERQTRLPWEVTDDDELRYSSICS